MKMFLQNWWMLIGILLIALFLRVYDLGNTPAGFHQDEVVNAYVGRFIFENGQDLYGNKWPFLYFDKKGDFPPVIPMYFSALGTFFFGLTQFAARIPIALLASFTVIPVYFLALWIFKNRITALFTALMCAIVPWHVSFSRIGAEGIMAATIFLFGLMTLVLSFQKKNIFLQLTAYCLLLSTYFLYPAFRIITPLTFVAAIFYSFDAKKNFSKLLIGATIVAFALTGYIGTSEWGKGRFNQTSMFKTYDAGKHPMDQFIFNEDNIATARIFNNKAVFYVKEFSKLYFSYFSPVFLFIEGGMPDWFDVPNTGLFYLSFLLLLLPILLPVISREDKTVNVKLLMFMFAILVIAPIPSALTTEFSPNTHRSILMSIMYLFVFAWGFHILQNLKKFKVPAITFFTLLLFAEFIFFFHNYFQHVSMYTAILRSDGNRQAVEYIKENRVEYDRVYMMASGWFPAYYLYFTNNFDKNLIGKFSLNLRTEKVDNVQFIEQDCPLPTFFSDRDENPAPTSKILIVLNSSCKFPWTDSFDRVGEIVAANKTPVYIMWSYNPKFAKADLKAQSMK